MSAAALDSCPNTWVHLIIEHFWAGQSNTCTRGMRDDNLQDLVHVAHAEVEGLAPVRLRGVLLPARARTLRARVVLAPAQRSLFSLASRLRILPLVSSHSIMYVAINLIAFPFLTDIVPFFATFQEFN